MLALPHKPDDEAAVLISISLMDQNNHYLHRFCTKHFSIQARTVRYSKRYRMHCLTAAQHITTEQILKIQSGSIGHIRTIKKFR
jgi:hypothetical protein